MTFLHKKISTSSVMRTILYDITHSALIVHFNSGTVWIYWDVPLEVYDGLISADSVGNYFNTHVRNFYNSEQYMTASEWKNYRELNIDASK